MPEAAPMVRVASGIAGVDAAAWDVLAGTDNPFVSHAFLSLLEESGSVGPGTGWTPAPLLLEESGGALLGAVPAYVKSHSQGEYVFDHAWADAWHRAGGRYYPKLQLSVPFSPVAGPRLLLADADHAAALLRALEHWVAQNGWSGAHATFVEPAQQALFAAAGWLRREDIQFHWHNRGYGSFEDFLGSLTSRKRKELRRERQLANDGVTIRALSGDDIRPQHWDAFWQFYQDTGARKWGSPYLTRAAFALMGQRMGDRLLLLLALEEGHPVAGALHVVGGEALYGRYWGCLVERPMLHFELCYYRAIDTAIERGLKRVEAGAQGGHKLARGYDPAITVSYHYLPDPGFRAAVADYLERERRGVRSDQVLLERHLPFRKI